MIAMGGAPVLVAGLGLQAFAVVAPVFLALALSITVQPLRRWPAPASLFVKALFVDVDPDHVGLGRRQGRRTFLQPHHPSPISPRGR